MAPDSNTVIGCPSGPTGSLMAGMRLFGLNARNSGLNCSPLERFTGFTVYGNPISSSATLIFRPLGVFQVHSSMVMCVVPQWFRCRLQPEPAQHHRHERASPTQVPYPAPE